MKINFDTSAHYFVQMSALEDYGFVKFKSSNNLQHWVECKLEPYQFDGFKYKLYAVPADPILATRFGRETFYSSDFKSLIRDGHIIKKDSEDMHVEYIHWYEYLTELAYVEHFGEVIVSSI